MVVLGAISNPDLSAQPYRRESVARPTIEPSRSTATTVAWSTVSGSEARTKTGSGTALMLRWWRAGL
jgi:hypothetical protein